MSFECESICTLTLIHLAHTHSSSPPPEPPSERSVSASIFAPYQLTGQLRFMDEGMDCDDKYRMVEDEFLTVAQKWTVHLHAAEYKRQEKMAKARNAETINSISRPVTDRMPDQTRRRVDGVARSKSQRSALEGLLGKKAAADDTDDSDADGLPYIGTTLHGLMDSPRRKAASLAKIGSAKTATRAAAGFQKPAQSKTNAARRISSDSPVLRNDRLPDHEPNHELDESTASSDEDDDLDAPIPAPKLEPILRASKPTLLSTLRTIASSSAAVTHSSGPTQRSSLVQSQVTVTSIESALPSFTNVDRPTALTDVSRRRAKRQELARVEKEKRGKEEQKKKKRDIIPTFL